MTSSSLLLVVLFITCFGHVTVAVDLADTSLKPTAMPLPTFTDIVHKLLIGNNNKANMTMNDSNMTTTLMDTDDTLLSGERKLRRGKRYLDFLKGSRVSWRTNAKNNLEALSIFAYGFGFRVNFNFPNKEDRLRPFYKRDLFQAMESVLDGHGFDGRACLLKSFCSSNLDSAQRSGGMMFKLLQIMFSLNLDERRQLPYMSMTNCAQLLRSHCPLDFHSMSTYTDDV